MRRILNQLLIVLSVSAFQGCMLLIPTIERNQAAYPVQQARPANSTPMIDSYGRQLGEVSQVEDMSELQAFVAAHHNARTVSRTPSKETQVQRLVKQLQAETDVARTHAASDLGTLGLTARKAVVPLAYVLRHDESKWVRRAAAKSLGKIGTPEVVEPLRRATQDRDKWVAHSARNALTKVERQLQSRPRPQRHIYRYPLAYRANR